MNRRISIIALVFFITAGVLSAQEFEAEELLRRAEKILYPDVFTMTMTIITEKPGRQERSMTIESRHEAGKGTLLEITAPARSRGIRFLQKDDTLWMYNPRSNSRRAIRLSPRDSFQGTLFSNNDIGDTDYTDNYTTVLSGTEKIEHPERGTTDCYILTGTAKNEDSPYGKIVMWLDKETNIPLQEEMYAKSGLLFKEMVFSDIKEIAGRRRPTRMKMHSMEQKDAYSTVIIEEMEQEDDLPDSIFTESSITR